MRSGILFGISGDCGLLRVQGLRLPQEKAVSFPGGVAAVDIAVDEIRVARVLEVVVSVLDLLPGLRDLRGEIEVLPVKGEPPVDIFLRCFSRWNSLMGVTSGGCISLFPV